MRIKDVLASKGSAVVVVRRESTVRELVVLLKEHNVGAVVVSANGHALQGIVSERDVIRQLAFGPEVLDLTVAQIMTAEVHTTTVMASIDSLMALMTEQRVRHVPVLAEDGRLCGIVSIGDVVKSRIGELEFERDQLEGYVRR